ncbi:MAG: peptidyl-prolyl cis-trans isomerase [Elusimicrobia bacterium]|nr:peptidyl-prolyl cis-trans isomerase [Elusimicrobiota bacterium]
MKPFIAFLAAFMPLSASAQSDREVVKVNGTPIRQSEVLDRLWKRYGPETLEEMIDELLLRQAFQSRNLKVSPAEVEKRVARIRGSFADPKVFESQLQQFGSSLEKFKAEVSEQLSQEKLLIQERKLSVNEGELKKAFEARREELGTPEAVHLRHMLVKSEAEARELAAKIQKGADFAALAREKSIAPTGKLTGGDYGFVSRGMLPPDIETIAFAMKKEEIKLLPTAKGFHLLQALDKKPAVPAEYGKVKDDLRQMLLQEKVKAALPDYLKDLRQRAEVKPQAAGT